MKFLSVILSLLMAVYFAVPQYAQPLVKGSAVAASCCASEGAGCGDRKEKCGCGCAEAARATEPASDDGGQSDAANDARNDIRNCGGQNGAQSDAPGSARSDARNDVRNAEAQNSGSQKDAPDGAKQAGHDGSCPCPCCSDCVCGAFMWVAAECPPQEDEHTFTALPVRTEILPGEVIYSPPSLRGIWQPPRTA